MYFLFSKTNTILITKIFFSSFISYKKKKKKKMEELTNQKKELKERIQDIELKLINAKKSERNNLLDELDELEEKLTDLKKQISKMKKSGGGGGTEKPFQDILSKTIKNILFFFLYILF